MPRERKHILIIEDNPGDAHLVRIFLKEARLNHELSHAETFAEGMEIIDEKEIELVLLDLSLPDSHGFKTLTNFLDRHPQLPVILLTGLNDSVVGLQSVKAGAQDYLVKGQFDSNVLSRVINYSLQRHHQQLQIKQSASKLAESEKRYLEAQKMARFGNWEMDIVTQTMKWSDEVFRIFGFQPGGIVPTHSDYINYVHPEDRSSVSEVFDNVILDGELRTIEYRIIVNGRSIRHVVNQIKISPSNTDSIMLVGVIQDITDHKKSEQLTIEKNMSDKVGQIKQEMLKDMGFLIRTPLTSVLNLTYLLENSAPTSQQKELLDNLKTSINELSINVNNLLNFSILLTEDIKLDLNQFKVHDFVTGIQKAIQVKAETKNIRLEVDMDGDVPEDLVGDTNKIGQILFNILENAIKFSNKNSKVNMKIFGKSTDDKGGYLISFRVKDNGDGMTPDKVQQLIHSEKLLNVETDDAKKSKLGLPIANRLAKSMDGVIDIDSKEGVGTVVTIELPLNEAKKVKRVDLDKPTGPVKILLVEDHFLNQLATRRLLTAWSDHVTVDIAENGLIGVEKSRAYQYDLILMDLKMPVMDGIEASQKIREQSNIPIIALSATVNNQVIEETKSVGIDDTLQKPFKPQTLSEKIMNLLYG